MIICPYENLLISPYYKYLVRVRRGLKGILLHFVSLFIELLIFFRTDSVIITILNMVAVLQSVSAIKRALLKELEMPGEER